MQSAGSANRYRAWGRAQHGQHASSKHDGLPGAEPTRHRAIVISGQQVEVVEARRPEGRQVLLAGAEGAAWRLPGSFRHVLRAEGQVLAAQALWHGCVGGAAGDEGGCMGFA